MKQKTVTCIKDFDLATISETNTTIDKSEVC